VEQAHIAAAFRFELSKVTVPAIRERMVASLRNASESLALQLATQLGMPEVPKALPLALQQRVKPEVQKSPALSLMARPGNGSIAGRKVAIFVAAGVEWAALAPVQAALVSAGAAVRLVGPYIGPLASAEGEAVDADASLENEPAFLFDGLVLPGGEPAVKALAADAHAIEGVANVYRHCKPMLVMPASVALLNAAGIKPQAADSGLVMATADTGQAIAAFVKALGGPRAFERETDPPRV
jgi:catalase